MSRFLWLALAFFVASCGGRYSAPRNIEDACAIIRERPDYLRAMSRAERKWGVPVAVQLAFIYHESGFVGNARTPHRYALGVIPMGRQSSAYGYSQALDGTWEEYQAETRSYGARRDRVDDSADFIGWYMAASHETLGIALNDISKQYLAYHEGRAGYARGTYRSKGWLQQIAAKVETRAGNYQAQLITCGKG